MSIYNEVQEMTSRIHNFLDRKGVWVAEARESLRDIEKLLATLLSVRGQEGVMLECRFPVGYNLTMACEQIVDLADSLQVAVKSEFNGIIIQANPGDSPNSLELSYLAKRQLRLQGR